MKTKTIITKAETLIEILNSKGFKGFVDSTSRNDLTESIYNEELELQIFLLYQGQKQGHRWRLTLN